MGKQDKAVRRAEKSIGKTTRVRLYKRKGLDEASIYVTGEITKAVYLGENEKGLSNFQVTLKAGINGDEYTAYVNHLPR